MNKDFVDLVYPTYLYVIDLQDRIAVGDEISPEDESSRIKNLLARLDTTGEDRHLHSLAKSALVYWIDEIVINSNWNQSGYWSNHTLEREIFDERLRASKFFDKARQARNSDRKDALEVFFLCVGLGFQGLYRDGNISDSMQTAGGDESVNVTWFSSEPAFADDWGMSDDKNAKKEETSEEQAMMQTSAGLDLPDSLQDWAGLVYAQLAPGGLGRFIPSAQAEVQREARPLNGIRSLKRWMISFVVMMIVSLVLLGLTFTVGNI